MNFSANQLRVLRFLFINGLSGTGASGADISKGTNVGVGSVYPFLTRLVEDGLATSEWEDICPKSTGRPKKRFYHLTGQGVSKTQAALADFQIVDLKEHGIPEPGGGAILKNQA